MMTQRPLVSVIMASFNHAEFIGEAIESVLSQTYQNIELLIADDGSTDTSQEIINRYVSTSSIIKFFPFKANRSCHIRNFLLKKAKGKYIAVLNSDDLFEKNKIQHQVEILEQKKDVGIVFTKTYHIDKEGNITGIANEEEYHINKSRIEWIKTIVEKGKLLILSSSMVRKNLVEKAGNFNEQLVLAPALDLWFKILLGGATIEVINEPLTKMRLLENNRNLSANTLANRNRGLFEMSVILDNAKSPSFIKLLPELYPDMRERVQTNNKYVLLYEFAKYCINNLWQPHQIFGINLLYELVRSKHTKLLLERKYGYNLFADFLSYSGKIRVILN